VASTRHQHWTRRIDTVTAHSELSDGTSISGAKPPATRHAYRLGLLVAMASVVLSVVLLPFALSSLLSAYQHPVGERGFDITTLHTLHGEWTKLNVAVVSISEADDTMTLRVSGFHHCPERCDEVERVQFYSVHADPRGALGVPPSSSVDLPNDASEIDQLVTLPITGDLIDYPFDHYQLMLGVTFSRVTASGGAIPFDRAATRAGLEYSVDNTVPRLSLAAPTSVAPEKYRSTGVSYDSLTSLNFSRPIYLQILTVLLTMLIVLAAAYGLLIRPFTQIIPTVGGLVLGVWGVRSLLVGDYPPDSTGVDLVLEAAILLLLLGVGVRAVIFMLPRSHLMRPAGFSGSNANENEDESDFENEIEID
jgi:hypothetical protein